MRAWFRPFVLGLLFRPLLLAPVAVLFAVAFAGLGEPLGVPRLFWEEDPWTQAEAGFGVGLLLFQVCFIGFLLDDGKDADAAPGGRGAAADRLLGWLAPNPPCQAAGDPTEDERWQGLRWFLLATWVPLLLAFVLITLSLILYERFRPAPLEATGGAPRWPMLVGLAASVAWTAVFVRLFHFLRARMGGVWRALSPHDLRRRREIVPHAVVALVFGLALVPPWPHFPTVLWCFLAAWWAAAHGLLLFLYRTPREPDRLWKHLLASAIFGSFFAGYQLLFLAYWAATVSPAWFGGVSPTPAVVICTLLALLANAYGFLRFHFRGLAYVAAVAALGLFGLVNGFVFPNAYPLRFPDLPNYDAPVPLAETDFQAALTDAAKREKQDPKPPESELTEELRKPYDYLARRYQSEARRLGDLPPGPDAPPQTRKELEEWADSMRMSLLRRERDRLESWREGLKEGERPKLVVVAVSGGAERAAYWTALVLDRLEREQDLPHFPAHVRVVTGASGGMVGAAHWAATLDGRGRTRPFSADDVARDALKPVAQSLLFTDLPTWPTVHTRDTDRGLALQRAWLAGCPEFAEPFRKPEFVAGEAAGWRPSLVFSPMMVEDGRRLLISNLYLPFLTENVGEVLSTERAGPGRPPGRAPRYDDLYRYSVPTAEFFHLFPDADDFRLATAVRMSASFPYVSPAAYLPTSPPRRVVDAGYYDDYGVDVAAGWIGFYRRWLQDHTSGVVLIQVRDEASSDRVLYPAAGETPWPGLDWLTGPLAGLLSARRSVMSFRNDERLQALSRTFNEDAGRGRMFTTVVFECDETIEMSWRLTAAEKDRMRGAAGPTGVRSATNEGAVRELISWWKEDHSAPTRP